MSRLSLAPAARRPGTERARTLVLGAIVFGTSVVASLLGADAARQPVRSLDEGRSIVGAALENGSGSEEVRIPLRALRSRLGRHPLDSATRVLYASVLLDLVARTDDTLAPAFHARRAVALAPVTVPVVRAACLVLARCQEHEEAVALARRMFSYDSRSASELLELAEPFLGPERIGEALPDDPAAWLAWTKRLDASGRGGDADGTLGRALDRWPENLSLRLLLAARATARKDWPSLERAIGPEDPPRDRESASLWAYRGRLRAARGNADGARTDALQAEQLGGRDLDVPLGDLREALGELDAARGHWTSALYHLPATEKSRPARLSILARLSRLEERRGRTGDAIRSWRSILTIDPNNDEARRHLELLGRPAPP